MKLTQTEQVLVTLAVNTMRSWITKQQSRGVMVTPRYSWHYINQNYGHYSEAAQQAIFEGAFK